MLFLYDCNFYYKTQLKLFGLWLNPLESFLNITMSMCIAFTLNIKEDTFKVIHINFLNVFVINIKSGIPFSAMALI